MTTEKIRNRYLVQGSWLTELPTRAKPSLQLHDEKGKEQAQRVWHNHLASLPKICRCEGLKDGAIVEEKVDFRRKYNDAYCSNCVNHVCKNPEHILAISTPAASTPAPAKEQFKMPTDDKLIDIAVLFNDGKLEPEKLSDMVGMCRFVLDRLYENNDIMIPSSKENT